MFDHNLVVTPQECREGGGTIRDDLNSNYAQKKNTRDLETRSD
jgi:hypothetical protein